MMPSVVFRTDASIQIGSGHVMRCLVLADALSRLGWVSRFICRELTGHQADRIRSRGYDVALLAPKADGTSENKLEHSGWLPVSQETDARQTIEQLGGATPSWIIVDHYALDAQWEHLLQPHCTKMLALDDLADRHHGADLLLDQNAGRQASDYDGLALIKTKRLIGPVYALLAPRFAELRERSLLRRQAGQLQRLLVTMGGVDKDNATGQVLAEIARLNPSGLQHIDVVLGANAPHIAALRQQLSDYVIAHELHIDTPHMADLMCDADLAVGASGGTNWERCCLGLPTILCTLATNQSQSAAALAKTGAAVATGDPDAEIWPERFAAAFAQAGQTGALQSMSTIAREICDGLGAERAALNLTGALVHLRPAVESDAEEIWRWRVADNAAQFYRSGAETPLKDHLVWFAQAIADPNRIFLIPELAGNAIGYVRFDRDNEHLETALVSICLTPEMKGRKLARISLVAAIARCRSLGISKLIAEVHRGNTASVRLFEGAGFHAQETNGPFTTYLLANDA